MRERKRFPKRAIVTLSGGKASAWCANWALSRFPKERVLLYFNDTKWEHPDLYRFLSDLSVYFDKEIFYDSDGRSPEQLFSDKHALANNRMPFCSHILKAKRLQAFYQEGDTLVFGIGANERKRARRLAEVYLAISAQKKKQAKLKFPLISNHVSDKQIDSFLIHARIRSPLLYRLGFVHNNCSGGCVRAGKKQWKLLYEKLPEVYLERERVEEEFRKFFGKDVHFFKDETLRSFRKRIETGTLSKFYDLPDEPETECIGICHTVA